MCVAFWSLTHPDYALILCSNRDEYLSRPTSHAHFHSFGHGPDSSQQQGSYVLSGLDLIAGGTWFGINRAGRVALLTNITEPAASYASSRGHLVSSFLSPVAPDWDTYVHDVTASDDNGPLQPKFAGFNLLVLSPSHAEAKAQNDREEAKAISIAYENAGLITNSGGGGTITLRPLTEQERRAGGLSNGVDGHGASDWPKVKEGQAELKQLLNTLETKGSDVDEAELVEELFKILQFQSPSRPLNRSQLRNSIQIPPLHMTYSLDPNAHALAQPCGPKEHSVVPPEAEVYATRLSTVLLVRRDGRVLFVERDIWKLASGIGEVEENSVPANDGPGETMSTAQTHQVLSTETATTATKTTTTTTTTAAAEADSTMSRGPGPPYLPLSLGSTAASEHPHIPDVVRGDPRDDRVFRFTLLPSDKPVRVDGP